ncbi:DUF3526 domain-containing protein [Chitinophaga horti]|uniref:DUF3526 domain-containing protein n=1 Tax=Chitinophaga horti TaxID=2920382 RepID=A0ABY6J3F4_9BACT|nr:DUF3526 domain-containing protein [Chitinophaga horti]UYQ94167.1 DUF3526 domain-containing protein [Chitinophaga horti]
MKQTKIIAGHFLKIVIRSRAMTIVFLAWLLLVAYAAITGYETYTAQQQMRINFQQQARQSWEANPDKHPHRMAHFGTFAFRQKHPLSMFDYGMESYTGNAVYLEAHKQNTVNFSEAGFSTGLLRFGEISLAMLVQIVLPLVLFFLGFNAIAQQKENGTLKVLLSQGAGFRSIIWGNSVGLFTLALIFLLPVVLVLLVQLALQSTLPAGGAVWARTIGLLFGCLCFLWLVSVVAICVSALSANSRSALLSLLGIWLLMSIVLPKTVQAIGSALHPAPGKIEFDTAVEKDILQIGDSHNPNDPHFKRLKDSVLKAHHADSVQQLPFNYSGFQMREGERMSAEVYNQRLQQLYDVYERQNDVSNYCSLIDPVIGIKNMSMALAGTDFIAYRRFQDQAEDYRYQLAQTMNELQMKYISNSKPKDDHPHMIGKEHWAEFADFTHTFEPVSVTVKAAWLAFTATLLWFLLSFILIRFTAVKAKAL